MSSARSIPSLPLLLEIGTEEIPDWMIAGALESLRALFEKLEIPHQSLRLDAQMSRATVSSRASDECSTPGGMLSIWFADIVTAPLGK